jgi:uncharacterized protein YkwD
VSARNPSPSDIVALCLACALAASLFASGCAREWPDAQREAETAMLGLVNAARAEGRACPSGERPATGALSWDEALTWAAREHGLDMGRRAYFDHLTPEGGTPGERMDREGYVGFGAAENISAGVSDAEDTFEGWMASEGHCQNIMDGELDDIGVGYAIVEDSEWTHYWVQTFGVRD